MTLVRTTVAQETLQEIAEEEGTGELGLSQLESEVRSYNARIQSVREHQNGYLIEIDASPLFPGGGGQPSDRGWVDEQSVEEVLDHRTLRLAKRPTSNNVVVKVDWGHRFDLMQQHTGQHIISGLALKEFGLSTLSFHLSADTAFVVFDEQQVTQETLVRLEERANDVIRDGRPVIARLATESDLNSGAIRCRKLPTKRTGGLRVIEILGLDINTCGGTHVSNTAQLQMIRLTKSEPHRGATRVYFECGGRVMNRIHSDAGVHRRLNQLLSCSPDQYAGHVERVLADGRKMAKKIKFLEMSIAEREALNFEVDDRLTIQLCRSDNRDMAQLGRMAQILAERFSERGFALVSKQDADAWLILLVGGESWIEANGRHLFELFDAKGGGRNGRMQGRSNSCRAMEKAIEQLSSGHWERTQ